MSSKLILNILCSVQRALLEHITSNLRAVDVIIHNTQFFEIVFYYNNEISEDEEELSSLTETEFMSDFPPPDYEIKRTMTILAYPNKIPKNGFFVYKRYEK